MLVEVYPKLTAVLDGPIRRIRWTPSRVTGAVGFLQARLQASIPGFTIERINWIDSEGSWDDPAHDPIYYRFASDFPIHAVIAEERDAPLVLGAQLPDPAPLDSSYTTIKLPKVVLVVDVPPTTTHDALVAAVTSVFADWKSAVRTLLPQGVSVVSWEWKINTTLDAKRTAGKDIEP